MIIMMYRWGVVIHYAHKNGQDQEYKLLSDQSLHCNSTVKLQLHQKGGELFFFSFFFLNW